MNLLIAFCLLSLHHVTPRSCRIITELPDINSQEVNNPNELKEYLIPLLEKTLEAHNTKGYNKNTLLPLNKGENSKPWNNFALKNKQLVEITPLIRKGVRAKPIAYIFSTSKHLKHNTIAIDDGSVAEEESKYVSSEQDSKSDEDYSKSDNGTDNDESLLKIEEEETSDDPHMKSSSIEIDRKENNIISRDHMRFETNVGKTEEKTQSHEDFSEINNGNAFKNDEIIESADSMENLSGFEPFGPGDHVVFMKGSAETEEIDPDEEVLLSSEHSSARDGSNEENDVEIISQKHLASETETVSNESDESTEKNIDYVINTFHGRHLKAITEEINESDDNNYEKPLPKDNLEQQEIFLDGSKMKSKNSHFEHLIEVVETPANDKDSKYNCAPIKRDGVQSRSDNGGRASKSYRLSFLFNK